MVEFLWLAVAFGGNQVKAVVTGVAGFIGSHLAEALIRDNFEVIGVDCFTDYYDPAIKRANIANLAAEDSFSLHEANLLDETAYESFEGADQVYHFAAQPGVRDSWGRSFDIYATNNILVTQRVLEAVARYRPAKLIFASSSSVYGDNNSGPFAEAMTAAPVSPYGMSKLSGEHLCYAYWKNYRVPTVCLRLFTVYGPRQRPEMAIHKFVRAISSGETIAVNGDGSMMRDYTNIDDIVSGILAASCWDGVYGVFNLGNSKPVSLKELISLLENVISKEAALEYVPRPPGDVMITHADIGKARELLGYSPEVSLSEGIAAFVDWFVESGKDLVSHE